MGDTGDPQFRSPDSRVPLYHKDPKYGAPILGYYSAPTAVGILCNVTKVGEEGGEGGAVGFVV